MINQTPYFLHQDEFNYSFCEQNLSFISQGYSVHENGYGVHESGNAYLAASLFEDLRNLITGTCEVPRVLHVELLEGRLNNGNIVPGILNLNSDVDEDQLIQFALDKKIKYLALFKLGFIFDQFGNAPNKKAYEDELASFIERARNQGIFCGYIADKTITASGNASNYNISKHNFNNDQKLNFVMLEHEYWNAFNAGAEFATSLDGTPRPDLLVANKSQIDDFFEKIHDDHLLLIDNLNDEKLKSANNWFVYDYIALLYLNLDVSTPFDYTTYVKTNTTARQSKAIDLDGKSDAIFLAYYQNYNVNNGKDFLDVNSTDQNVYVWRQRLSYFGNSSTQKTNVIPLYSIEDNNFNGNPFLGHVLEDPITSPPTLGENLPSVESAYINQHQGLYNSPSYPSLQNIALSAFGWFVYDKYGTNRTCFFDRTFTNVNLATCSTINFPITILNDGEIRHQESSIRIYPNPADNVLNIESKNIQLLEYYIFDVSGKLIQFDDLSNENIHEINISNLSEGLYFMRIKAINQTVKAFKFLKQ